MKKKDFRNIYISDRLKKSLDLISDCAVTTVTAPMGYGKTTAVNWYLTRLEKKKSAIIIRISTYSDSLPVFWKSVQSAFSYAGYDVLNDCECPADKAAAAFLSELLCRTLKGDTGCYIFIDDFHLLANEIVTDYLGELGCRLPENVHLIISSREKIFDDGVVIRMGRNLNKISLRHLQLDEKELAVFACKCGMDLNGRQLDQLFQSSEGWFSAIYLNFCHLEEYGTLPDKKSDIYKMFVSTMIRPLTEELQQFLTIMGLADEFTIEMAKSITAMENTETLLSILTEKNAFVTYLANSGTFRFHHMMKECAEQLFAGYTKEKQALYLDRYGAWYEEKKWYIHALSSYKMSGNFHAMLQVIQKDAGILLASLKPETVEEFLEECPKNILKEHPFSILVLMRSMFNWKKIPQMMKLKEILLQSVDEHTEMSQEERGNLLGECDLILSFLMYNDISKMSQLHRSASVQMSRPAISILSNGGWTFGSPSVLMMFHREAGHLNEELIEMNECMPHYYKITNGHGQGAETLMSAEAKFMQGRMVEAQILLEQAYGQIEGNNQENIRLCCDFLALRLFLASGSPIRQTIEQRREELLKRHNTAWLNLFDSACGYYYALLGAKEQIPVLFRDHMLYQVNFLAPGRPMMEMIENQVYLVQGEYAKVIGRSEALLDMCWNFHYGLVVLHICIQTVAGYEQLGKRDKARIYLAQALVEAVQDRMLMPFVENYFYISDLLKEKLQRIENQPQEKYSDEKHSDEKIPMFKEISPDQEQQFIKKIIELGENYGKRREQLCRDMTYPEQFSILTQQELRIVELMSKRLSNKEIAAQMFLSEGTIKQYINQIYSKLHIEGDTRAKRQMLLNQLNTK